MINGAASLVYLFMLFIALVPVGIYCHIIEQQDKNE